MTRIPEQTPIKVLAFQIIALELNPQVIDKGQDMPKQLWVIRGPEGSGTRELAQQLAPGFFTHCLPTEIGASSHNHPHQDSLSRLTVAMLEQISPIAVYGEMPKRQEVQPYVSLAKSQGYTTSIVICEAVVRPDGVLQSSNELGVQVPLRHAQGQWEPFIPPPMSNGPA